jgi:hypothetical protein
LATLFFYFQTVKGAKVFNAAVAAVSHGTTGEKEGEEKLKVHTHSYCCLDYAQVGHSFYDNYSKTFWSIFFQNQSLFHISLQTPMHHLFTIFLSFYLSIGVNGLIVETCDSTVHICLQTSCTILLYHSIVEICIYVISFYWC